MIRTVTLFLRLNGLMFGIFAFQNMETQWKALRYVETVYTMDRQWCPREIPRGSLRTFHLEIPPSPWSCKDSSGSFQGVFHSDIIDGPWMWFYHFILTLKNSMGFPSCKLYLILWEKKYLCRWKNRQAGNFLEN
jgi:hypothetical protein